jgi:hypothetical protein
MNFQEAMKKMKQGCKIRRPHWQAVDYIDEFKFYNERRSDAFLGDLVADDWEVVE